MTSESTMRAVISRYFHCLDSEDWLGMGGLWCQDAELRAVGARTRHGREAVVGYFSRLFTPWPRHQDRPTRVVVSERDDTALAEVHFTGTTPQGREVEFDAVDVFDFRDGRIGKLTNWYDVDFARRALAGNGDQR